MKSLIATLILCCLMILSAVANFIIEVNPCLGIIVPSYAEIKEERRVLSTAEQRTFLNLTDNTFYKELYRFMLCTGLRVGELGALQWKDIDFKEGFINVKHNLRCQYQNGVKIMELTTPKTKNSFRKIPFFNDTII